MVVIDERRQMKIGKRPGKAELTQESRHGSCSFLRDSAAMPIRTWPYGRVPGAEDFRRAAFRMSFHWAGAVFRVGL
jgi:hypothetical protein